MLSTLDKILVMVTGGAVVAVVLIIVVCFVAPMCPIHRLLPERIRIEEGRRRRNKSFRMEKDNAELTHLNISSYRHGYGPKVDDCVILPPMKVTSVQPAHSNPTVLDNNANNSTVTPRRPAVLLTSQESMVDSTYSSMTPSESRPSSPVSSKSDPSSNDSIHPSFPSTVDASPVYGSVILKLTFASDDPGSGKGNLVIDIREALDLPVRDNQTYGDPFARLFVTKQRRSLRRPKKSSKLIAHFETPPCKRTRNPQFSREFRLPITKSELKDCELRVAVYDRDKYTGPTAWGECTLSLRDVEMSSGASQLCLELTEPTHYQGEVLLGLMYLPTAERMTVTISKVANLRYQDIVSDVKDLNLHAKALLLRNGRLVGKKKTVSHCGSAEVTFDESVAFDVPTEHLNNLKLVVTVAHRECSEYSEMDTATEVAVPHSDKYFGKVVLGGESHWDTSLQRPREQVLRWHVLR